MLFSEFISECNVLCDIEALLEEYDTVEWDPNAGAEFKGVKGITQDVGRQPRPEQAPDTTKKPGVGGIVMMQDRSGQLAPTVIISSDRENALIQNPARGIRSRVPLSALQPAPPNGITKQLAAKYPNRAIWVYDSRLENPL